MQIICRDEGNPTLYHNIIGNDIISYERILGVDRPDLKH